ncbi:protein phosphatase 1 regulatory subunit 3C isoform X1 [Diabrotica undecimpunctata]|uniref:protein phosphatase 1 regulatory subunit 3C isoform X1 n=1 Tax=Diabrotica undecimpunctata TaxID=50387 RepID=UPI003B6351DB
MCSMEYEMLVSHSPPVFSHSPPTGGFLTDYAALRLGADFPRAAYTTTTCKPLHHSNSFNSLPKVPIKMPAYPKRPCLVIRPTEETSSSSDEDPTSPTRLKKKVVFADDKGMSLTHVRVMTEPSNVPPLWSYRFLAEVTQGLNADPVGQIDTWEITFPQPASDYVAFRKRLDTNNVTLENVIIKEAEDSILGTVKVRNLSFHKEVFVRCSTNDWKNYEDCFCTYVPNNMNTNINVLYDTFSFKIPLPNNTKKLEFCACFKCDGKEYWDNNYNKNYVLLKKSSLHRSLSNDDIFSRKEKESQAIRKCNDIVQAKMESWSEFASWTHLDNNSPYW